MHVAGFMVRCFIEQILVTLPRLVRYCFERGFQGTMSMSPRFVAKKQRDRLLWIQINEGRIIFASGVRETSISYCTRFIH